MSKWIDIPAEYTRNPGSTALIADAADTKWAQKSRDKRIATETAKQNAEDDRVKFNHDNQPRDPDGKFRKILARLKQNLGGESTQEVAKKIEAAEAAQVAGNYELMRDSGNDIIKLISGIKGGSIAKGTDENLRRGASDLGRVMAYLPLPQGNVNAKVRFSDLPPASSDLVRTMVERVTEQVGNDVAEKYTKELNEFMSGARTMTSDEMAIFMNKLLRVLA